MNALENDDYVTWDSLKSGDFVMAKSDEAFTRLFTDQILEHEIKMLKRNHWWDIRPKSKQHYIGLLQQHPPLLYCKAVYEQLPTNWALPNFRRNFCQNKKECHKAPSIDRTHSLQTEPFLSFISTVKSGILSPCPKVLNNAKDDKLHFESMTRKVSKTLFMTDFFLHLHCKSWTQWKS